MSNTVIKINKLLNNSKLSIDDKNILTKNDNDVFKTIAKVFKVDYNDISDISVNKEGMTNFSFLFTIDSNRYVFRVPGRKTELLIKRSEEAVVYKAIKDLKISDKIVYIDKKSGYKITKYYKDITTLDINNKNQVIMAINTIKDLHKANLKVNHDFDIVERINYYQSLVNGVNVKLSEKHYKVSKQIKDLISFIDNEKREFRLCHIDPVASNFLILNEDKVKLIDWEYAGMSDPILDIAMFGGNDGFTSSEKDNILKIYLNQKPTAYQFKLYYTYIALSAYLWYLWTIYKEAAGDDYGNYANLKLKTAKEYSDKAKTYWKD